jgi:hypothetical protein
MKNLNAKTKENMGIANFVAYTGTGMQVLAIY